MSREKKKRKQQLKLKEVIKVIKYSKVPWFWVAITFFANVFYNQILYKLPVSTGKLMSGDMSSAALREVLLYYLSYAIIAVLQAAIVAYSVSVTTRRARTQLWGKMLKINEAYYDSVDSSEMLSAVTFDLGKAMPAVITIITALLPDLWYLYRALKTISSYNFILLITVLVFIPIKYIYTVVFGRKYFNVETKVRNQIGSLTSKIGERIENIPLVKSFNKEEDEYENGGECIDELYKANVQVAKLGGISLALENGIEVLQQFIIMVIAVMLLQSGKIDMGQWIAFFLFTTNISSKFSMLIRDWISIKTLSGSLERTSKLYNAEEENEVADGKNADALANYDIVFDDVSFDYDGEPALSNISFKIKQGQKVAIVGACGSGKSTTLSLLERFYSARQGQVLLGGIPVEDYQLEDYRRQIAYVPQMTEVFSDSIRDVLSYGNNIVLKDEDIIDAAKKTGFIDYIVLQDNDLDAPVKNGGGNMSGGQLQKMIITRELLRESKIVLYDEPTSALDATSSRSIKELMMLGMEDKTVIVVTHDLSLTDEMDQIILLDDGNLVATGTYDELMTTCDKFRSMVENQREVAR